MARVATHYKEKSSTAPLSRSVETTVSGSGIRDNYSRGKVGDFLRQKIQSDSALSVVSAYFTIYAFEALKEQLKNIDSLRFLYGS